MKVAWQTKTLGDLCTFQRGLTYTKSDEVPLSTNVVLRANNISVDTNYLDFSELKYIKDTISIPENKKVKRGSLLICTASGSKSHLGKVAYINDDYDYAFGGFMGMITPCSDVLPKYLFYLLTSPMYKDFICALSDGVNINNLKFEQLRPFPVPLPRLSDQGRIVAKLDEAFAAIAEAKGNAEKNVANACVIFESELDAVFVRKGDDWDERSLSALCNIKHGFAFDGAYFRSNGDYVLLTPGNFYEKGGYRDRGEKQKYYTGPIPEGFLLSRGDMLVAMTEQAAGLLGSPILVPQSGKFLHNQRLGLVTAKDNVPWLNEFFFYVFNTGRVRREIHDSASGVKVRHTSPAKIGQVVVSFPRTKRGQKEVVDKLGSLFTESKKLEVVYRRKLAEIGSLQASMLHYAFAGHL